MIMKKMKRHILSQGDLDGACFLYSILNTYVSLTTREPGNIGWDENFYQRWDKATKFIPYLTDFFLCSVSNPNGGTGRYDDNANLFQITVERVLSKMSTQAENGIFDVSVHKDRHHPKDIKNLITKGSVVIVCPDGEHWVACVEYNKNKSIVYTACSWEFHKYNKYEEHFHKKSRVYSNSVLKKTCTFDLAIQIISKDA